MPMLDPQREIQALVDTFVADLSQLAKRIAIEQIKAAFELGAPPLPPYVAGSSFTLTSPPPAAPAARGRGRRAARDHRDVEGLRDKLVAEQHIRTEGARRGTRYFVNAQAEAAAAANQSRQTELNVDTQPA